MSGPLSSVAPGLLEYLESRAAQPILVLDREMTVVGCNGAFRRLVAGDPRGEPLAGFLHGEAPPFADLCAVAGRTVELGFGSGPDVEVISWQVVGDGEPLLLVGERAFLTSSEAMDRLSELVNDNAALTRQLQKEKAALERAGQRIEQLSALLPICCECKMIRTAEGAWERLEEYFYSRAGTTFTHSYCPDCLQKLMDRSRR